jgi:hypothetical protein
MGVDNVRPEIPEDSLQSADQAKLNPWSFFKAQNGNLQGSQVGGEHSRPFQANNADPFAQFQSFADLVDQPALQPAHIQGQDDVRDVQRITEFGWSGR